MAAMMNNNDFNLSSAACRIFMIAAADDPSVYTLTEKAPTRNEKLMLPLTAGRHATLLLYGEPPVS